MGRGNKLTDVRSIGGYFIRLRVMILFLVSETCKEKEQKNVALD